MTIRRRLDGELIRKGFAGSKSEAEALITANRVLVAGSVANNPTRMVEASEAIHVEPAQAKFVGRGGFKLEAALDQFKIDPTGKRALDVGASTGGFTDCLLQRHAASVVALDVGRAQLHQKLRADTRVRNLERTNVKDVASEELGGPFELITADLSFISLRGLARKLVEELAAPNADLILLIKPQFEATHAEATLAKGVIAEPKIWQRTVADVLSATKLHGAATMGLMVSPIRGGEGNVEFLAWLTTREVQGTLTSRNVSSIINKVSVDA